MVDEKITRNYTKQCFVFFLVLSILIDVSRNFQFTPSFSFIFYTNRIANLESDFFGKFAISSPILTVRFLGLCWAAILETWFFLGDLVSRKNQQNHVVFALRTYRNGSLFPHRISLDFRFKNLEESFIARPKKTKIYEIFWNP